MSCLCLDELPLSEQVACAAAWADRLVADTRTLLARLEPPADAAGHYPPVRPCAAGGSNLLSAAEDSAMIEKMVHDHPPLLVCFPGHRAHLWQATGDRAVVYYVECSLCGMRTARFRSADDAAHAWGQRAVSPILATAAA